MEMKMKNIHKSCHPQMSLSGIFLTGYVNKENTSYNSNTKAGDSRTLRAARHSGMTTLFNTKAFTLIELLVVVLIIGILAAVAVPQYTLAVNKTRFSNLRTLAASFIQAAQVYKMTNGQWPNNFEDTALTLPKDFQMTEQTVGAMKYTCGQNDKTFCCIIPGTANRSSVITCSQKDESFAYAYFLSESRDYCVADPNDTNAVKLCQSMTKKKAPSTSGWAHYTPEGSKDGHHYYVF